MHAKACTRPLKKPAIPGLASAIFTPVEQYINSQNYFMEASGLLAEQSIMKPESRSRCLDLIYPIISEKAFQQK